MQQVSDTMAQVTRPSILVDPQPAAFGSATAGHPEVYYILTIIWIAGCTLFLGRWWFRQFRFARSLRTAEHEAGSEFMHTLESLKDRLGVRRRTMLQVVWRGSETGVCGVWRPVLVLPEEMSRQLSPAEVEAVLAHELVHVAGWDNLWSNLQMVVCCIFWFYPVVWLLIRRLIAERERSCDERVIGALRNSQAYASGLIKMTSIGLGLRVAGVSPMADSNLKRRIEDMNNTKHPMPIRPPEGSAELVPVSAKPPSMQPVAPGKEQHESIKVGGNVQDSKLIKRVDPIYPENVKRARLQGRVILTITTDAEGNVTSAVVSSGHRLLNDAVMTAVKQWKYSPTLLNGKPIPVMATVTVPFDLK